jgi:hypothetical protein
MLQLVETQQALEDADVWKLALTYTSGSLAPNGYARLNSVSEFRLTREPITAKAGRCFDHSKFVAQASDAAPARVL